MSEPHTSTTLPAPRARLGTGKLPLPPPPAQRWLRAHSIARRMARGGVIAAGFGALAAVGFAIVPGSPVAVVPIMLGVLGFIVRSVFRIRAFNRKNSELIGAINQGAVSSMEDVEALARSHRDHPTLHGVAVYNLAILRLLNADLDGALELLAVFERARLRGNLKQVVGFHIASCYGLLGDLVAAELWLDEANRRIKLPHLRADVLPRALLLLRRREHEEAAAFLAREWPRVESMYVGRLRHGLELLRAFALVQSGTPNDDERVVTLVGNAKLSTHDYRFLAFDWPLMRAFLEERGLQAGES